MNTFNPLKIVPDNQCTTESEDIVGVYSFANTIYNLLNTLPTENGFSVAITGQWGLGKTTIINFIKEIAQKDKNCKYRILNFSPWNISNKENLLKEFFFILKEVLQSECNIKKSSDLIYKYYEILMEGINFIPKVTKFVPFLNSILHHFSKENLSLLEIKNQIIDYLENEYIGKDLLIIIDDLDRLSNDDIMEVFNLIKEIANFPHITYLLSFDKNHVANAINIKSGYKIDASYGFDYLEKFIQISWAVPELSNEILANIVKNELQSIVPDYLLEINKDKIDEALNCLFYSKSTIRSTKLLINSYKVIYQKAGEYLNFLDLLVLLNIQLFFPILYTFLLGAPDFLLEDKLSEITNPNDRLEKNLEIQKTVSSLFQQKETINDYQKVCLDSLFFLFPAFKYNYENPVFFYSTDSYILCKRRIQESSLFSYYFTYYFPEYISKNSELHDLMLNCTDLQYKQYIDSIIAGSQANQKIQELYESYSLYIHNSSNYSRKLLFLKNIFRYYDKIPLNISYNMQPSYFGDIIDFITTNNNPYDTFKDIIDTNIDDSYKTLLTIFYCTINTAAINRFDKAKFDNIISYFINNLLKTHLLDNIKEFTLSNWNYYYYFVYLLHYLNQGNLINNLLSHYPLLSCTTVFYIIKEELKKWFSSYFPNNTYTSMQFWNNYANGIYSNLEKYDSYIANLSKTSTFYKIDPVINAAINDYLSFFNIR